MCINNFNVARCRLADKPGTFEYNVTLPLRFGTTSSDKALALVRLSSSSYCSSDLITDNPFVSRITLQDQLLPCS